MKSQRQPGAGMGHIVYQPVGTAALIYVVIQYAPPNQAREQTGKTVVKCQNSIPYLVGITGTEVCTPGECPFITYTLYISTTHKNVIKGFFYGQCTEMSGTYWSLACQSGARPGLVTSSSAATSCHL